MKSLRSNPSAERPSFARQVGAGVLFLAAIALVAVLGSASTLSEVDGWYAKADKVPWSPPNWLFGPVWSLLYLMNATSGWLVWRAGYRAGRSNAASRTLAIYALQLVFNGLWTPVFFAAYPRIGPIAWWASLAIMFALLATTIWFGISAISCSRIAAFLMVPYLAWLLFAASLNIGIPLLN